MANLGENDPGATEPIDPELPQPAVHGQVKSSKGQHSIPEDTLRTHLAEHMDSLNTTKDYGGHGDIAQNSQGGFTGSGMSDGAVGADYQTSSADSVGDADSQGY